LRVLFQDQRNTGRIDLEATEMAMRSALHRAGAAALSQLLQFPAPSEAGRTRACPCGQPAHYREQRSKPVLTAVGPVVVLRPYYLCAYCGVGQFPVDVELDIENTEFSPGVRRMQAMVGQDGWDGSSGGEERDGRSAGQEGRPAGPYAGSQTGMRLHPDDLG
jgi:hypothetical protein